MSDGVDDGMDRNDPEYWLAVVGIAVEMARERGGGGPRRPFYRYTVKEIMKLASVLHRDGEIWFSYREAKNHECLEKGAPEPGIKWGYSVSLNPRYEEWEKQQTP